MSEIPKTFGPSSLFKEKSGVEKDEIISNTNYSAMKTNPSSPVSGAKGFSDAGYFFTFDPLNATNYAADFGYAFAIEVDGNYIRIDGKPAVYRFPINPTSIAIDTPTATSTDVTMKGIFETHNGAPLRRISITGTTGVLPVLQSLAAGEKSQTDLNRNLEYAFKNTIKAYDQAKSAFNKTKTAFTSGGTQSNSQGPLNRYVVGLNAAQGASDAWNSGFAKIHDLKRFLDFYISGKKEIANKKWRLVFYMKKDDEKYYCTLNNYSIQKTAGTIEYNYNIQLTAWRRAPLGETVVKKQKAVPTRATSTTLSNVINGITRARIAVAKSLDVLKGIRSDIHDTLIAPMAEIHLLATDTIGAAHTAADFTFSGDITRSLGPSIKQFCADNTFVFNQLDALAKKKYGFISSTNANGTSNSAIKDSVSKKLSDGKSSQNDDPTDTADQFNNLLNTPEKYPEFFQKIPIDDLSLSSEINKLIDSTLEKSRSLTAEDVIQRKNNIVNFTKSVSDALGGGSSTYNRVMGESSLKKSYKKMTTTDIELLSTLNDIVMQMDSLISTMDSAEAEIAEDYYSFYKDYALNKGIDFSSANISKFYVPFPYDTSLEVLALTYLGDPQRWIEIAALNSLKAPYVDEIGTNKQILSSSGGNTLLIGSDENLYVGQIVEVSSNIQSKSARKIRSIDVINASQTLITFEESAGPALTSYKPKDNAVMKVYAPNTVNSNMLIAIPSTDTPVQDSIFKISPELEDLDKLARIAKIDILLDSQGDWILSGGGDIKFAVGLANITQAAMMKVKTKTNQLLQAPEYGNPVEAGLNTADVTAQQIANSINKSFDSDPRFSGVVSIEVNKTGPAVVVNSLINIADTGITLPISSELPKISSNK